MKNLKLISMSVILAMSLIACNESNDVGASNVNSTKSTSNLSNTVTTRPIVAYLNSSDFQDPNVASSTVDNLINGPWKGVSQVNIAFLKPHMAFNKNTASDSDPANSNTGLSFAAGYTLGELRSFIEQMHNKGTKVFFSVGGWDYSCAVLNNSNVVVDYYNQDIGGSNYCEPPQDDYSLPDYNMDVSRFDYFPNPLTYAENGTNPAFNNKAAGLPNPNIYETADQAKQYIQNWVDFVQFIGADGVDLDYEETYFADFSSIPSPYTQTGSLSMKYTAQKFASILYNLEHYASAAGLKVSIAAVPVGVTNIDAPNGSLGQQLWGGNLKGLYYQTSNPNDVPTPAGIEDSGADLLGKLDFIGVMTYDLDTTTTSSYCPILGTNNVLGFQQYQPGSSSDICVLDKQVATYLSGFNSFMQQIGAQNVPIVGGIETGVPAYPQASQDQSDYYNVPLKTGDVDCSSAVVNGERPSCVDQLVNSTPNGIILWELNKIITESQINSYNGSYNNLTKQDLDSAATPTDVINAFQQ